MTRAAQLFNIAGIGDAFSVLRQPMAEHVRHENDIDFFADGADSLRWLTDVASSTNQFWVSVAHGVFTDASFLHFVDQRSTCKLVVDDSRVTSQHVNGETHTATR